MCFVVPKVRAETPIPLVEVENVVLGHVGERAGLSSGGTSVAGAFLDADGDGLLDLYVGNYLTFDPDYQAYYSPDAFPGPQAPSINALKGALGLIFGVDIHYYAKVLGHELVTRRDLVPAEAKHKRAEQWY